MAQRLLDAGCVLATAPKQADCIIVNTCSFIQAATEESIEAIFEMCELPHVEQGRAKVIVAGCMPSRYGDELEESLKEIDTFVPCSKEDDIVAIVESLFPGRLGAIASSKLSVSPSVYVKISDGCDRFCSFCTIPFIRGRYHSYSLESIDAEVQNAVDAHAREIVLIAQDTGRWGEDFAQAQDLSQLVGFLAEKYPSTWFRIMYVQPEGVSDALLDVIAQHENVASYLDIPFQHANKDILKAMNRKGSGSEYLSLIKHIRNRVPGVTLRTTLIAGFPGESEDDFDELCSFVEDAELDYVGVFAYSREEGTRAAKLPDQLDEEEKQYRARRLRDIADAISAGRISQRIGKEMDVLVEGREEDGQLFGRALCQAPDVDGVVYLSSGEVGSIVHVTIADTLMYEMEAE